MPLGFMCFNLTIKSMQGYLFQLKKIQLSPPKTKLYKYLHVLYYRCRYVILEYHTYVLAVSILLLLGKNKNHKQVNDIFASPSWHQEPVSDLPSLQDRWCV